MNENHHDDSRLINEIVEILGEIPNYQSEIIIQPNADVFAEAPLLALVIESLKQYSSNKATVPEICQYLKATVRFSKYPFDELYALVAQACVDGVKLKILLGVGASYKLDKCNESKKTNFSSANIVKLKQRRQWDRIVEGWLMSPLYHRFIGMRIRRFFRNFGKSEGVVDAYLPAALNDGIPLWHIIYDDNIAEDVDKKTLLIYRKQLLDDLENGEDLDPDSAAEDSDSDEWAESDDDAVAEDDDDDDEDNYREIRRKKAATKAAASAPKLNSQQSRGTGRPAGSTNLSASSSIGNGFVQYQPQAQQLNVMNANFPVGRPRLLYNRDPRGFYPFSKVVLTSSHYEEQKAVLPEVGATLSSCACEAAWLGSSSSRSDLAGMELYFLAAKRVLFAPGSLFQVRTPIGSLMQVCGLSRCLPGQQSLNVYDGTTTEVVLLTNCVWRHEDIILRAWLNCKFDKDKAVAEVEQVLKSQQKQQWTAVEVSMYIKAAETHREDNYKIWKMSDLRQRRTLKEVVNFFFAHIHVIEQGTTRKQHALAKLQRLYDCATARLDMGDTFNFESWSSSCNPTRRMIVADDDDDPAADAGSAYNSEEDDFVRRPAPKRVSGAGGGRRSGLSKAVEQYDLVTDKVLRRYYSGKEASDTMDIANAYISNCCNGTMANVCNFGFRFYKGPVELIEAEESSYVPVDALFKQRMLVQRAFATPRHSYAERSYYSSAPAARATSTAHQQSVGAAVHASQASSTAGPPQPLVEAPWITTSTFSSTDISRAILALDCGDGAKLLDIRNYVMRQLDFPLTIGSSNTASPDSKAGKVMVTYQLQLGEMKGRYLREGLKYKLSEEERKTAQRGGEVKHLLNNMVGAIVWQAGCRQPSKSAAAPPSQPAPIADSVIKLFNQLSHSYECTPVSGYTGTAMGCSKHEILDGVIAIRAHRSVPMPNFSSLEASVVATIEHGLKTDAYFRIQTNVFGLRPNQALTLISQSAAAATHTKTAVRYSCPIVPTQIVIPPNSSVRGAVTEVLDAIKTVLAREDLTDYCQKINSYDSECPVVTRVRSTQDSSATSSSNEKIVCLDPSGRVVGRFSSASDAAQACKVAAKGIRRSYRGRQLFYGGYVWRKGVSEHNSGSGSGGAPAALPAHALLHGLGGTVGSSNAQSSSWHQQQQQQLQQQVMNSQQQYHQQQQHQQQLQYQHQLYQHQQQQLQQQQQQQQQQQYLQQHQFQQNQQYFHQGNNYQQQQQLHMSYMSEPQHSFESTPFVIDSNGQKRSLLISAEEQSSGSMPDSSKRSRVNDNYEMGGVSTGSAAVSSYAGVTAASGGGDAGPQSVDCFDDSNNQFLYRFKDEEDVRTTLLGGADGVGFEAIRRCLQGIQTKNYGLKWLYADRSRPASANQPIETVAAIRFANMRDTTRKRPGLRPT